MTSREYLDNFMYVVFQLQIYYHYAAFEFFLDTVTRLKIAK